MDNEFVKELERTINMIILALRETNPYAYAFLSTVDIIATDNIPTAATDGVRVFINPEFAKHLLEKPDGYKRLAGVLLHEILHVIFQHPVRGKNLTEKLKMDVMKLVNIITDGKIDVWLKELLGIGNHGIDPNTISVEIAAKLVGVSVEDLKKRSTESIVLEVIKKHKKQAQQQSGKGESKYHGETGSGASEYKEAKKTKDGYTSEGYDTSKQEEPREGTRTGGFGGREFIDVDDGDELEKKGRKVFTGDRELKKKLKEAAKSGDNRKIYEAVEDAARTIRQKARITESSKLAGEGAGDIDRMIDEVARGHYDWRKLLRRALSNVFSEKTKRTWSRLSKKGTERPGKKRIGKLEKLLVAVDVSGSITDDELAKMYGAIVDVVSKIKPRRIEIIYWDYGIREIRKATPSNIRDVIKRPVEGCGGTMIRETLEYIDKNIVPGKTGVVILSDWYLGDDNETVKELLTGIKRRSILAIVATHDYNKQLKNILDLADIFIVLPIEDPLKRAGV